MTLEKKKIGLISLGCDKNRIDSEIMLSQINDFATLTYELDEAEIIIINTCAFLESARAEAIDTILQCNELRNNKLEKIIVTGCLPQKFIDELYEALPEVDAFLGTYDYDSLKEVLTLVLEGKRANYVGKNKIVENRNRMLSTPPYYAYLRIADGCNNHCTYCLIPKIRGGYKSVPKEKLIAEASELGQIEELILVAQDTTRYGEDLYGEPKLVDLIEELSKLSNIEKIRLLYCYPDKLYARLINEFKTNDKLLKYIDIPLQHADGEVLKLMNRRGNGLEYLALIDELKRVIPDIAIRSTFIVGFPKESEQAFENLKEFIRKAKFFNAGFFAYSREEGTASYNLDGQIEEKIKKQRLKEIYKLQREISKENLKKYKGQTIKVLADGIDYDKNLFKGRAYFNAPDVDGCVYFKSEELIEQGKIYNVKITKTADYDLYGRTE